MSDYPALVIAIWKDDLKTVKKLSVEPDILDPDGRTPLMAAAIDSKIKAAEILVKARANVNFLTARVSRTPSYSTMPGYHCSGSGVKLNQLLCLRVDAPSFHLQHQGCRHPGRMIA